jgi:hypothetical protein
MVRPVLSFVTIPCGLILDREEEEEEEEDGFTSNFA